MGCGKSTSTAASNSSPPAVSQAPSTPTLSNVPAAQISSPYRASGIPLGSPSKQQQNKLNVPFHLNKNSVVLKQHVDDPSKYSLTFETDTKEACIIIIHFATMEVYDKAGNFLKFFSDATHFPKPLSFKVEPGDAQKFPEGLAVLDTTVINDYICTHKHEGIYPLVVELRNLNDRAAVNTQTTFIYCEVDEGVYEAKVDYQKIMLFGITYEQCEIFGLESNVTDDCLIWLSEKSSIMIMPCRHLCLWLSWSKDLQRNRGRKCPVCRERIRKCVEVTCN